MSASIQLNGRKLFRELSYERESIQMKIAKKLVKFLEHNYRGRSTSRNVDVRRVSPTERAALSARGVVVLVRRRTSKEKEEI